MPKSTCEIDCPYTVQWTAPILYNGLPLYCTIDCPYTVQKQSVFSSENITACCITKQKIEIHEHFVHCKYIGPKRSQKSDKIS